MRKRWPKCVDRFSRAFVQFLVVTKLREPQKINRGDGTRGGFGAVIIVFHPQHDAFVLAAGAEVTAVLVIIEQAVLRRLQLDRKLQPFDIERGFVEIEKSLNHERVVIGKAFDLTAAFAIIAKQHLGFLVVKIRA